MEHFAGHIMPRPRIDEILSRAAHGKLVYVVAGAGYGKTQAVRSYIEKQHDAVVRWIQLSESDNIGSRYWESLTHSIRHDNPDLAEGLLEFGFPDTLARFKQFADILKNAEHRSQKTFLILDDFHVIHSKQALVFAERCAHLKIPGACVILISRTEPNINAVALFSKGQVSIVTEDELRFSDKELSEFFKFRNISLPAKSFPQLSEAAGGWAIAIQLLSLVLKKTPGGTDIAIDVMKKNIFRLMETEAYSDFPEDIQKAMVKLSLVSDLPLGTLWNNIAGSLPKKAEPGQMLHPQDAPSPAPSAQGGAPELASEIFRTAPQLASFVWFDSFTGQSRVHPLYWEFLKSKQDILSQEEKQDTFQQAAEWCRRNNFYSDAVKYLAALRQYSKILDIFMSYPLKLPHDICGYFLNILDSLKPDADERADTGYIMLQSLFAPLLLVGMDEYERARERSLDTIAKWESSDAPIAPLLLGSTYSNLAYIDMYACTVTHRYEASKLLEKSAEYFSRMPGGPRKLSGAFAIADIRSFACLVGEGGDLEEFEQFLDMARQTARHIADASHNMYYGYDDLAACELAFYKNHIKVAKYYAYEAILKAREGNQHSIEAMAAMYQYRIAMLEGDYALIRELLHQKSEDSAAPYFWDRKFLHELAVGLMYAQLGLLDMMPPWLISDEDEAAASVSVPARELICAAKYHIAAGNFDRALTLLLGAYPRKPQERFLFGELTLSLLMAVARIKTGDVEGALKDFEKAYALSCGGVFEMPFIELGKDLHPLASAAMKTKDGGIAKSWLIMVERKASAYTKKTAVILDSFKAEKHIEDAIPLSRRERDILEDLYHGLLREEIAASRHLSINTVHKVIQSLFIKLNAYNKADAIRIATQKKLI